MKERKSWTAVLLCIRRYASGPLINNFGRQFRRGTGLAHTEARKSCTWLNDVTRLSRYLIAFLENVPRNRIAFGFGPTLRNRAVVRSSRKLPDHRFFCEWRPASANWQPTDQFQISRFWLRCAARGSCGDLAETMLTSTSLRLAILSRAWFVLP